MKNFGLRLKFFCATLIAMEQTATRDPALQRAIDAIGGYTATAQALGIAPSSVHNWRKAPYHWVRRLHDLSGVPLHELAPDLFDAPKESENAA